MGHRKEAKLSSRDKQAKKFARLCPECGAGMVATRVAKVAFYDGPAGMFWRCSQGCDVEVRCG